MNHFASKNANSLSLSREPSKDIGGLSVDDQLPYDLINSHQSRPNDHEPKYVYQSQIKSIAIRKDHRHSSLVQTHKADNDTAAMNLAAQQMVRMNLVNVHVKEPKVKDNFNKPSDLSQLNVGMGRGLMQNIQKNKKEARAQTDISKV